MLLVNNETEQFVNVIYSGELFPAISKPTRLTNVSATLIDSIFTNNVKEKLNYGILIHKTSDNLPVFVRSH